MDEERLFGVARTPQNRFRVELGTGAAKNKSTKGNGLERLVPVNALVNG
ncbi:hypothetical protein [Brevibacillus sp. AY1]|nr:hypothetical protein [Brevibacillus sp. AY1]MDH4620028.1 hypothetical protein [Brevibacillus sp. AY1]